MFREFVYEKAMAPYVNKIILFDEEDFENRTHYSEIFSMHGFSIIHYTNDLEFRIHHENQFKDKNSKIVIFANKDQYIPYDILRRSQVFVVSYMNLFPNLNSEVLKEENINLDLLCMAYQDNYEDLRKKEYTITFLQNELSNPTIIKKYVSYLYKKIEERIKNIKSYKDWFYIAKLKSKMDILSVKNHINIDDSIINERFKEFVLKDFGKLSSNLDSNSPVLVSKAMDYMNDNSFKFAIIVMDGMSEFDWSILSKSFEEIHYQESHVFAMIPTITSISRQCLLSNKYPSQLINPWTQAKEKKEFIDCAKSLGFQDNQIGYERGYDADFSLSVRCASIIINDIDDMVHGQMQGREGMLEDVTLLSKSRKLVNTTKRLLDAGFDVYISADHGNTYCTGLGKLTGTGVETATKSHRMLVLNKFADKQSLIDKYKLIEYPKYYLDKQYDYLVCDAGISMDAKESQVMSHGGISLEEVIVPFIKIKKEDQ